MMRLIQKHWRFAATLAVSAAAMVYAHMNVSPKAEAVKSSEVSARKNLETLAKGVARDHGKNATGSSPEAIALSRARTELIGTLAARQASETAFLRIPAYRISSQDGDANQQATRYQEILRSMQSRLRFLVNWMPKRIALDASGESMVGIDFGKVVGDGVLPQDQRLLRLDILGRVATAVYASDLERVSEFAFAEFTPTAEMRRRIPSMYIATNKPRLLDQVTMRIAGQGRIEAVAAFLADILRSEVDGARGRALTYNMLRITKVDWETSADDLVQFEAQLAANNVRLDAELLEPSREQAVNRLFAPEWAKIEKAPEKQPDANEFGTGSEKTDADPRPGRRSGR